MIISLKMASKKGFPVNDTFIAKFCKKMGWKKSLTKVEKEFFKEMFAHVIANFLEAYETKESKKDRITVLKARQPGLSIQKLALAENE
jgi:hypothetical protein